MSFFFDCQNVFLARQIVPQQEGTKNADVQKKWSFSVVGLDNPSRPSDVSAIPVRKLCAAAARFRLTFSLSPGVTDRNWCSRLFFSPTMACLSAPFFNRVCAHGILHFRRQCRLFSLSGGIFVTREKKGMKRTCMTFVFHKMDRLIGKLVLDRQVFCGGLDERESLPARETKKKSRAFGDSFFRVQDVSHFRR